MTGIPRRHPRQSDTLQTGNATQFLEHPVWCSRNGPAYCRPASAASAPQLAEIRLSTRQYGWRGASIGGSRFFNRARHFVANLHNSNTGFATDAAYRGPLAVKEERHFKAQKSGPGISPGRRFFQSAVAPRRTCSGIPSRRLPAGWSRSPFRSSRPRGAKVSTPTRPPLYRHRRRPRRWDSRSR